MNHLETPPEQQEDEEEEFDCSTCGEGNVHETEDNHWVCDNCNYNYGICY